MRSKIKAEIRAELRDPQGKLIRRLPWKPANSLLKQFIQILAVQMAAAAVSIKDVGGVDRSVSEHAYGFRSAAILNEVDRGILIGTGTTPVTMADNKLETQVSANITHAVESIAVENPSASTWRVSITRVFTNNTGATLGIREVVIYCLAGATPWFFAMDRTLYSVDVPNGVAVTLTYRITISL